MRVQDLGATIFHALDVPLETRLGRDGFTRPVSHGAADAGSVWLTAHPSRERKRAVTNYRSLTLAARSIHSMQRANCTTIMQLPRCCLAPAGHQCGGFCCKANAIIALCCFCCCWHTTCETKAARGFSHLSCGIKATDCQGGQRQPAILCGPKRRVNNLPTWFPVQQNFIGHLNLNSDG